MSKVMSTQASKPMCWSHDTQELSQLCLCFLGIKSGIIEMNKASNYRVSTSEGCFWKQRGNSVDEAEPLELVNSPLYNCSCWSEKRHGATGLNTLTCWVSAST